MNAQSSAMSCSDNSNKFWLWTLDRVRRYFMITGATANFSYTVILLLLYSSIIIFCAGVYCWNTYQ